jgi:hypothetical protein
VPPEGEWRRRPQRRPQRLRPVVARQVLDVPRWRPRQSCCCASAGRAVPFNRLPLHRLCLRRLHVQSTKRYAHADSVKRHAHAAAALKSDMKP